MMMTRRKKSLKVITGHKWTTFPNIHEFLWIFPIICRISIGFSKNFYGFCHHFSPFSFKILISGGIFWNFRWFWYSFNTSDLEDIHLLHIFPTNWSKFLIFPTFFSKFFIFFPIFPTFPVVFSNFPTFSFDFYFIFFFHFSTFFQCSFHFAPIFFLSLTSPEASLHFHDL